MCLTTADVLKFESGKVYAFKDDEGHIVFLEVGIIITDLDKGTKRAQITYDLEGACEESWTDIKADVYLLDSSSYCIEERLEGFSFRPIPVKTGKWAR